MNKKEVRIIVSVLVLFTIIFLIYALFVMPSVIKEGKQAFEEELPSTHLLTSNDSCLIIEKYRDRIKVDEVYNSKVRGPVSVLFFDSLYRIINHKIELINDVSLKSILFPKIESSDLSVGYTYGANRIGPYFSWQMKAGVVKPVSEVYFSLSGDSLTNTSNNDSILSYHLVCKNVSIRYGKDEPVDICITGSDFGLGRTVITPMDVLLLKRKKSLYFSIMIPFNSRTNMPTGLLNDIILGKL